MSTMTAIAAALSGTVILAALAYGAWLLSRPAPRTGGRERRD